MKYDDRVARCPYCGRDVYVVMIECLEKEDVEMLEKYKKVGYLILDIDARNINLKRERCPQCPPRLKDLNKEAEERPSANGQG